MLGAQQEIFPQQAVAPGKFALYADIAPHPKLDICDGDLSILADKQCDYGFVGQNFQTYSKQRLRLVELVRKLKADAHLIVMMPTDVYTPESMRELVGSVGAWTLKDTYFHEDHFLQIYKRKSGHSGVSDRKKLDSRPRACIVRYGAMGDMIMLTPLIKQLHDDGYAVTLNITPYSSEIIKLNPYVSNIIYQERDAIPNPDLGDYWNEWAGTYDKWINLSESIEGTLLKVEGRRDYFTTNAWRHAHCNRNYYDFTMQLGGYDSNLGSRGELHFSAAERNEAREFRSRYSNEQFVFVWALNGSSFHKVYGLFEPVLTDFLDANPNAVCITVGDERAKSVEFEHPRLVKRAGVWNIRQSLAFVANADLVIGPESVIINGAGCTDVPKIPLLSHSSHENLCKHWTNDYCLAPNVALAPCYGAGGCHQLHYTRESCPIVDVLDQDDTVLTSGPACAMGAIEGERLIARIEEVMKNHHPRKTK